MGSAMDALKYGWSGLYGGSANASATAGAPNAMGGSGGGSQTDLISNTSGIGSMYNSSSLMTSNSMKDYGNLQHETLSSKASTGLGTKSTSYIDSTSGSGGQLKSPSNYSADSLSRSYFDSAMALKGYNDHHQQMAGRTGAASSSVGGNYDANGGIKSFTPESGRTSSDSPDHTKSSSAINSINQHQNQHGIQHHQSTGMGTGGDFSSQQQQQAAALQAYYSQSMLQQTGLGGANSSSGGIGTGGSGSNAPSNATGGGSLPPLLPMAAQLSQYAGAAAAAANGAASGYQQSAAAAAAAGEYRRPLSVLF